MKQGGLGFLERHVKERLVGATILVALIVAIVPELLSGPKRPASPAHALQSAGNEATRNVTVDLATSKAPPLEPSSVAPAAAPDTAADASAAQGVPETPTPQISAPTLATLQAQRVTAPLPEEAAVPSKTATPQRKPSPASAPVAGTASHLQWSVQLGSFASKGNAEKLAHQLQRQGYSAFVQTGGRAPRRRYRVRVGPMADRPGAERVLVRLKKNGHAASIVSP